MLVDSRVLVPEEEQLDDVEKARRERMRIGGKGIIEYVWAPDGKSILFPLAGDLYLYVLDAPSPEAVRRLTETDAFETDAKVSEKGVTYRSSEARIFSPSILKVARNGS